MAREQSLGGKFCLWKVARNFVIILHHAMHLHGGPLLRIAISSTNPITVTTGHASGITGGMKILFGIGIG